MSKSFDQIRKENKELMMELQGLDMGTSEGQLRRLEIKKEMEDNTREMRAFATAFGSSMDTMPRIMQIQQKNGNYGKK